MTDAPIKISINEFATGKIPQGDPLWRSFNDKFVCQELAPLDLANSIYTGHAYAGWHKGRRCIDNFLCAQHIGVDMDSGDQRSTFDELLQHDFFKTYGGLIHTTPSHAPDNPRARLIFFLDTPITDATAFQAAAKFIVSLFPGADGATTDASRFFYGCFDCELEIPFNTLPLAHLRYYYATAKRTETQAERPIAQYYAQQKNEKIAIPSDNLHDELLKRAISRASAEGRNHTGLWLAAQLRDNAYSQLDAERVVKSYQASVQNAKAGDVYTEQEALRTLRSAYGRPAREPWRNGQVH